MKGRQIDNKDISSSHSSRPIFDEKGNKSFFSHFGGGERLFFNSSVIQPKLEMGNNVSIETITIKKQGGHGGAFYWSVSWKTSGKSGYIVQKIESSYELWDLKGNKSKYIFGIPLYWEAWTVNEKGKIDEIYTGDTWGHPNDQEMLDAPAPPRTTGKWSIKGTVYWVDKLDLNKGGWSRNNPNTDAGGLLSTIMDPKITSNPVLARWAKGSWDTRSKNPKDWTYDFDASH